METRRSGNPNGTPANLLKFVKGTSGNPGGITKAVKEVRDLCRKMTPIACSKLDDILKNEPDNRIVLEAIKIVFSRSIGKEREAESLYHKVQNEPGTQGLPDIKTMSDDQLARIQRILAEPLP